MTQREDSIPLDGSSVHVQTRMKYRRQSSTTSRLAAAETWIQCRYVLAMMFFFGLMNMYMMRANLSIALIAMVDQTGMHKQSNHTEVQCSNVGPQLESDENLMVSPANKTANDPFNNGKEKFHWAANTRGWILSSFFAGYFTTQILGGYLEHKYGGRIVFGTAVFVSSIVSLLTPTLAKQGPYAFMAARFILGLSQGPMYPVHHGMWGKWAPPLARSKLISIAMTGTNIGTALSYNLAGWLAESIGWQYIFYVMGCFGLTWCFWWYMLAFDSPSKHPRISDKERRYIENSIGTSKYTKKMPQVPWKSIFTSKLFWGLFIGHFCANYGNYNLLSNLPSYLKQVFKADIKTVSALSAIPFISVWFFTNIGGQVADKIRKKKWMKTLNVRRVLIVMAQFIPAVFLVLVGSYPCNLPVAITFISLAACFGGLSVPGFKVVHIEIAPRYSGILYAITNTFATLSGHFSASIAGEITENVNSVAEGWRLVFIVGAVISAVGGVVVLFTLSTEVQEWAKEEEDFYDDEEKIQQKLDSDSSSGVFDSTTA